MTFVIGMVVVAVVLVGLGVVLARRGSGGLGSNADAGRSPEEFRVPGSGGGNAGGFGAG